MDKSYAKYDENGKLLAWGGVSLNNFGTQPTVLLEENFDKVLSFAEALQRFVNDSDGYYNPIDINSIEEEIKTIDKSLREKKNSIKYANKEKSENEKWLNFWKKMKTICEIIFAIFGFIGGLAFMAFCVIGDYGSIKTIGGILGTFAGGAFFGVFFGVIMILSVNKVVSGKIQKHNTGAKKAQDAIECAENEISKLNKRKQSLNRSYMEQLTGSFYQIQPPPKKTSAAI